jgi:predicted site-specific integrase-resolvase
MSGNAIHIVVTSQDRLARSGFELLRWIIEFSGGRIESLEESIETEKFNTKELIGFITSFCNAYYGKRSVQRRKDIKNLQED